MVDFCKVIYNYGQLNVLPMFPDPPHFEKSLPTIFPDKTFGSEGIVTTQIGDSSDAHCALLQSDGKIVVAGGTATRQDNGTFRNDGFVLARYMPNGDLDSAFGQSGIVVTGVGAFQNGARAITIQIESKIVAVGTSRTDRSGCFTLARYDLDGSLDVDFGQNGVVITRVGDAAEAKAIVIQPDGKIIVAGTSCGDRSSPKSTYHFALARYTDRGELDDTFGSGGIVITAFAGHSDFANAVALQSDGGIVSAGACETRHGWGFALARYNSHGTLDASFGQSGKVMLDWGIGGENWIAALGLQSDGKLVAVGRFHNGTSYIFALARFNGDGQLDRSFGDDGTVTASIGNTGMAYANTLVIQSDGKLVCGGYADGHFALTRHNTDGTLDATFGRDGLGITDFGSGNGIQALLLQADGALVAVGEANTEPGNVFAIARYPTTHADT